MATPSLVYFPDITITPNHHALARRFGLFDRFFVNAECSSQGHIWSTAAYVTNYGEKIVPSAYAGKHADVGRRRERRAGARLPVDARDPARASPSATTAKWSRGIPAGR